MAGAFEGKRGLILGVANKRSIAWAIAQQLSQGGATLDASVRYLAWDLGQKNIRVNAISAGPVRTLAARSIAGFPTMEAIVEERSPLHRHIEADDVGAAAAFLLSDAARNVTGTTLYVDSGYHAMGM